MKKKKRKWKKVNEPGMNSNEKKNIYNSSNDSWTTQEKEGMLTGYICSVHVL